MPQTATKNEETQEIPVVKAVQTVESLVNEAESRFRIQVQASQAILAIEKVRIMLAPLVRADALNQDEIEAAVLARTTLESAQRRLLGERKDATPVELPLVGLNPPKEFVWDEENPA